MKKGWNRLFVMDKFCQIGKLKQILKIRKGFETYYTTTEIRTKSSQNEH